MSDPFQSVRPALVAARAALQTSVPSVLERLEHIEHQLTPGHAEWLGDPKAAYVEIERIAGELRKLQRTEPATATGVEPLKQSSELKLLPGVQDGLDRLAKAQKALRGELTY